MRQAAILFLAVCLLLTGCLSLDDRAEKSSIFRFVQEKQALLTQCMETGSFDQVTAFKTVQKVDVYGDHVDFYCGGAGFGPATAYCGFFYTESENMCAVWCAPGAECLTPSGSGYLWEEKDGDNRYYVEQICEHYYYYEASF